MVCLSYRGYWTSHDRPSERGIDMDCEAALQWVGRLHRERAGQDSPSQPVVVLWGQSIGCGFATNLAARSDLHVHALVLETPFTHTRDMLRALYPQKWLPYQYLWPFLRNHLDSLGNLSVMARRSAAGRPPLVYVVDAGRDEIVPADHAARLCQRCQDVGLPVERRQVRRALHNEVTVRKEGRRALAWAISSAVTKACAAAS